MRVVSLESHIKRHQPLYVFNFFIFDLEYLIRVQSSEQLHAKRPHPQSKPKNCALWRIYSSNESAPTKSKTGFYADRDPNKQEVGVIFAESGSEL
jgi:hypothetical protein